MRKKLLIVTAFLLCLFVSSCSNEEMINDTGQTTENGESKLKSLSVEYIPNDYTRMRSFLCTNRVRPEITEYFDSYYQISQIGHIEYLGNRYNICKYRTLEASLELYRVYNNITGNESLATQEDVLRAGEMRCEHMGFIYKYYKIGLRPLDEYYSKSKNNYRYLIYNYEIKDMQSKGEDYEYVRTLGYVCQALNKSPKVSITYSNKSTTYNLAFLQVVYGKNETVTGVSIPHTPGRVVSSPEEKFPIGGMLVDFQFWKPGSGQSRYIRDYVYENSTVDVEITESDDIILRVFPNYY